MKQTTPLVEAAEIKRRLANGESVIAAWRTPNPKILGGYFRTWDLVEINRHHRDYMKVYLTVKTKKEAHQIVITQQLP